MRGVPENALIRCLSVGVNERGDVKIRCVLRELQRRITEDELGVIETSEVRSAGICRVRRRK